MARHNKQPAAALPNVIRAEPGKPWPEPPAGGRWSRNAVTGDLTLIASTEDARARSRQPGDAGDAAEEQPAAPAPNTNTPQE